MRPFYRFLIPIIFLILLLGGFFGYKYYQNRPKPINWLEYANDQFKFNLSYPETFAPTNLSEDDEKAKIIYRAEQIEPSALVSLRYEERLGAITLMQKGNVLDILAQNVNKGYPQRFPDFKKEKEEKTTIDGVEAIQFYFTYLGGDKQTRMKQRFIIVTRGYEDKKLGTVAFYLSFQSKESDFEKLNSDFQEILDSFKFF